MHGRDERRRIRRSRQVSPRADKSRGDGIGLIRGGTCRRIGVARVMSIQDIGHGRDVVMRDQP